MEKLLILQGHKIQIVPYLYYPSVHAQIVSDAT